MFFTGLWVSLFPLGNCVCSGSVSHCSPVGHRVVLEYHHPRQLTGVVWMAQPRSLGLDSCESFLHSLQDGPGFPGLEGDVHNGFWPELAMEMQPIMVNCNQWCFNPVVSHSRGRGRYFKVIEFSNWNFKSNWERMITFLIWKASATCPPPLPSYFLYFWWALETRVREQKGGYVLGSCTSFIC